MEFYKSLVQVDCGNNSIIIDIDEEAFQQEVQVLFNNEWHSDPEKFIDTGFNHDDAEVNENRSLVLKEGSLYATYAPIDLEFVDATLQALKTSSKLPEIDLEALVCTFEGQTFHSIFFEDIKVYENIKKRLRDAEFEEQERNGMTIEHEFLRRLIQILKMPVRQLQSNTNELSDRTRIAGKMWANLKDDVINDDYDYKKQVWWVSIIMLLLFFFQYFEVN